MGNNQNIIKSDKESLVFRILKRFGLIGDSYKYGNITILGVIRLLFSTFYRRVLFNYAYKGYILEPLNKKRIRPWIWRRLGCKVGQNVTIGHSVRLDFGNAKLISVGDNVVISNGTTILCHKRDISKYSKENRAIDLPFIYEGVTLEEGCQIGLNSTIMPNVKIGRGAIIGSCSLVTKDIAEWSVAVGSPAKVIKTIN